MPKLGENEVGLNEKEIKIVSFDDYKNNEEITEKIVDSSIDCAIKNSEKLNDDLTCEDDIL